MLYASGEESAAQLHLRADRLGVVVGSRRRADRGARRRPRSTRILAAAAERTPAALIVDSIQTLTAEGLEGPAGSVGQIREATAQLGAFAREHGVPVVLVGHVTKDGSRWPDRARSSTSSTWC